MRPNDLGPDDPVRILHVVNPVSVPETSDLFRAQPITFASIQHAMGASDPWRVTITAAATIFPEDDGVVPDWMVRLPPLDRSVLDVGQFEYQRKLPLLRDVLTASTSLSDVDAVVYSNVDIAVMPYFYEFIGEQFRQGTDGMVINRRTIPARWTSPADLTSMYAEVGAPHPGRDCFVFTPSALKDYDLGDVIIGAGDVGRVLTWNVACQAQRFIWFRDQHLTFHLGDDRSWHRPEMAPYHDHNNDEARAVFARLEAAHGALHHQEPWSLLLPRKPGYWAEWRRSVESPPGVLSRAKGRIGRWVRARSPRRPPW